MKIRHVVGLDLSLTSTGVAALSLDTGIIRLERVRTSGAKDAPLVEVLARIGLARRGIISHVPLDRSLVVVEAPSHGSRFGKPHERAGLWWQVISELHGRGHVIAQAFPRTRAKYAAGHFPVADPRKGPSKSEIVAATRADFPHLDITNSDIADALAVARMGARHLGSPIDPSTPQRVQAVAAVRWPETSTEGMN
ncbi:hypothetical protein MUN78_04575 [Leucobacter allii]|uniref:Holliday junction resolvase RuvC n=1 Tax=Leucobacter allii TaxID=2932247 RepID=A0ABY4FPB7_9MICO|nr:hypothetical protein [Leucobacter allii]UOQ58127.1 hypothetical protein MUN78_04575 [Leucobacter allii]